MTPCWKSLSGELISDLPATLRRLLGEGGRMLHVGTDSKVRGSHTDYVTVVAVLEAGRGGRILYSHARERTFPSLAQRLIREAELSLFVALDLVELVPQDRIVLHIDANQDERHRSSKYVHMLAGMGLGNGFQVRLKPDAWCATHVADHLVKEKHLRAA